MKSSNAGREETMSEGPAAFEEEMAEILESFIVETREILERLGQDLLTLEKGTADQEMLNTIFRAVHTVKGTSSFLGLDQMTGLAHRFEDVLNKVRRGELTVTPPRMDVMLEAYDLLRVLLENIEARKNDKLDLDDILAKLKAAADPAFGTVPVRAGGATVVIENCRSGEEFAESRLPRACGYGKNQGPACSGRRSFCVMRPLRRCLSPLPQRRRLLRRRHRRTRMRVPGIPRRNPLPPQRPHRIRKRRIRRSAWTSRGSTR